MVHHCLRNAQDSTHKCVHQSGATWRSDLNQNSSFKVHTVIYQDPVRTIFDDACDMLEVLLVAYQRAISAMCWETDDTICPRYQCVLITPIKSILEARPGSYLLE